MKGLWSRISRALVCVVLFNVLPMLSGQERIDFNSQVKPILSDYCFACHGPDEAERKTDFRLDQKASALELDTGVIVPFKPAASRLIERIMSEDPDVVMPPSTHRKKLSVRQKQILKKWIELGADWSEHWAFQEPQSTESPKIGDRKWPRNFIDHYVLERLDRHGVEPSPVASPHTLLRRLSVDLTGLPPSFAEVNEFEVRVAQGEAEEAYAEAVESRLASIHFGERQAVQWLDLVRYADSVGYHGDQSVSVSPYRDYVIDAFNENMPFDQFTREQLAGDLLELPTLKQKIASGYNRLGMMSAEGGVQPEEYLNKYAADRVRTTASVWLGVTLGCAECHDHKFDPFSTREFYEFSAFFADIKERGLYDGGGVFDKWGPYVEVASNELPSLVAPLNQKIQLLESTVTETKAVAAERIAWEKQLLSHTPHWESITPLSVQSAHAVQFAIQKDGSVIASGESPVTDCYLISARVDSESRSFRLEALPHSSLPKNGPGRAGNGNFVVTEFVVIRGDHSEKMETFQKPFSQWPNDLKSQVIELVNPTASFEQADGRQGGHPDKRWSAASAIDHDVIGRTWGWAILPEVGKSQSLVVQVAPDAKSSTVVTIVIRQNHTAPRHTLGKFRLSHSKTEAVVDPLRGIPKAIQEIVRLESSERNEQQVNLIRDYYLKISPRYRETNQRITDLVSERERIRSENTRITLVTVATEPRERRVLTRGDWMDKSGDVVQPGILKSVFQPNWDLATRHSKRPSRLDLANWIVDAKNPLTARVFVNRTWRTLFGSGLSNSLDDFGAQGEVPSHPELLDRLAIEFVESGWDVKRLVRTIVLSSTYRQSSRLRDELTATDPENRLLGRQSRFRFDAEFVRDHVLAVGGLLNRRVGGASTKPYQPAGLYRHLNFPARKYQSSVGQDQYRRGIYTHWQRQFLHPAMKTFDAPSREECTAARPRSNTPLAALVMLNDPSYVESARALATMTIEAELGFDLRIDFVFRRAFSRPANIQEKEVLSGLLKTQSSFYESHVDQARELVATGQTIPGRKLEDGSVTELAAWTSLCRAVMNMHEFISRK